MPDRAYIISRALEHKIAILENNNQNTILVTLDVLKEIFLVLKEHEAMKQKMWNALYAEEDKLEKKFVGSEDHSAWFTTYRPWLQRGFEIAIKVIAEQEGQ